MQGVRAALQKLDLAAFGGSDEKAQRKGRTWQKTGNKRAGILYEQT